MKQTHIELFETLATEPDGGPVEKGLLVLSTPRSGSTLFCDVLTNDGQIGICDEWFNEEYFKVWQHIMDKETFDLKEYLTWVAAKTVKDTGVFAIHVHIGQLINITSTYNFHVGDMAFDHMTWIYRKDKIAQAVSLAKAASTDQWKSTEPIREQPDMSMSNISKKLSRIIDNDQFYRRTLALHVHSDYAYEGFRSLFHAPFNKVLNALGKDDLTEATPSTEMQRDPYSIQVAREFRNYLSGV